MSDHSAYSEQTFVRNTINQSDLKQIKNPPYITGKDNFKELNNIKIL